MKRALIVLLILTLLLTACAPGSKPLIAGDASNPEKSVNTAPQEVTAFFDQLKPIVSTVVTSLTEIANTLFSAVPGIGISAEDVEKIRTEIRSGGE